MPNIKIISQLAFICADPAVQKAAVQTWADLGQVRSSTGALTDEVQAAWKRGCLS